MTDWEYWPNKEYYINEARKNDMNTYEATVAYSMPMTAVVTIETPKEISLVEAEDLIMEEFDNNYPEAIEPDVIGEVKELS